MFKERETLFTEFSEEEFNHLQEAYTSMNGNTLLEAVDQDYKDYIESNYGKDLNDSKNLANKEKLVIIDGSSLLTTSFFANLPSAYNYATTEEAKKKAESMIMNAEGIYVNGIYTALRTLLNDILRNSKATHLAVTLDLTRNSFRKQMYPDYKATRKETDPILKSQYPLFKEILESCGIKVFESDFNDKEIYEADDFTGSLVNKFSNEIPVAIFTKDRDHFQLLKNNVVMWAKLDFGILDVIQGKCIENNIPFNNIGVPNGCFEYTNENLFGVKKLTPDIVVDVKALAGDSGDNIPGVKGVSETTASELMMKYKTIEALYEDIDKLNGDKKELKAFGDMLKKDVISTSRTPVNALLKYREEAFLSKKLGKIKCDIELDCTLDDLRLNINKENLRQQLDKYKMYSLKSLL